MGQAKKRGTFEQRRDEALSRVSLNPAQSRPIVVPTKPMGFRLTALMAMLIGGVHGKRGK